MGPFVTPPGFETGQPDRLITQGDLSADACCRGGKIGLTCVNCVNNPINGGTRNMNYDGPGFYRHYKGREYQVLGLVRLESTKEPMVLYVEADRRQNPLMIEGWVRPLVDFNAKIDGVAGTGIDGTPRFVRIR